MEARKSRAALTIRSKIIALAQDNGVHYQRLADDELAEAATRLSDDNVATDNVEDLMVALKRSGAISGGEMVDLLSQYLNEKYHVRSV